MVFIIASIYAIFIMLYFGLFRLFDYKKKEFLQFIMMYAVVLTIMVGLSFIFAKENAGENWHLHLNPLRDQIFIAAFYVPPTFGIAYLLYPFKIIKRNRTLLWVLLVHALLVAGFGLLNILVAYSNM